MLSADASDASATLSRTTTSTLTPPSSSASCTTSSSFVSSSSYDYERTPERRALNLSLNVYNTIRRVSALLPGVIIAVDAWWIKSDRLCRPGDAVSLCEGVLELTFPVVRPSKKNKKQTCEADLLLLLSRLGPRRVPLRRGHHHRQPPRHPGRVDHAAGRQYPVPLCFDVYLPGVLRGAVVHFYALRQLFLARGRLVHRLGVFFGVRTSLCPPCSTFTSGPECFCVFGQAGGPGELMPCRVLSCAAFVYGVISWR